MKTIRRPVIERFEALKAVMDEPECPGEMPDEMWSAIQNDRDAVVNAIQIAVKLTKQNIRQRIFDLPSEH